MTVSSIKDLENNEKASKSEDRVNLCYGLLHYNEPIFHKETYRVGKPKNPDINDDLAIADGDYCSIYDYIL